MRARTQGGVPDQVELEVLLAVVDVVARANPAHGAVTEALDGLIARLSRIVEQMERTEDLAAIVESLRVVIRTERDAELLLRQMRDAEGNELFRDKKDGEKRR